MADRSAFLLWDHQHSVPLTKLLSPDDQILLLTPVAAPASGEPPISKDPFEPLGRAISARHPPVRHVPYTKRGGITGTHAAFIRRCELVLFVISAPPGDDEPSQADLAETAARLGGEGSTQIIISCCDIRAHDLRAHIFPTVVQVGGYKPAGLEKAATLLFSPPEPLLSKPPTPQPWPSDGWSPNRDLEGIAELWRECLPERFHLPQGVLSQLLRREGYARHLVVREDPTMLTPRDGSGKGRPKELLGFCATYVTYPYGDSSRLLGSVAVLLVRKTHRGRGIGRTLHDRAVEQLLRTRGVDGRLQLGSTFPRLLHGLPTDVAFEGWFRRRGWSVATAPLPGLGQTIAGEKKEVSFPPSYSTDWLLRLDDVPERGLSTAGLTFRPAKTQADLDQALRLVERDSGLGSRGGRRSGTTGSMGWYDQYVRLRNTSQLGDVIIGFEGDLVVSAAILYTPTSGSPVADDLPWARAVGDDVGGLTCICIADDDPEMVNSRDTIMVRLLDNCIRALANMGLKYLYLDGIRGGKGGSGDEAFRSLGLKRWSRYSEGWMKALEV